MTQPTELRAEFENDELKNGRVVGLNLIGGRYTDKGQQDRWETWQELGGRDPVAHTSTEQPGAIAAIKTLQHLGYTYNNGEMWKPPIGEAPNFDLVEALRARLQHLEASQAQRVALSDERIIEIRKAVSTANDFSPFADTKAFARAILAEVGITQEKQG